MDRTSQRLIGSHSLDRSAVIATGIVGRTPQNAPVWFLTLLTTSLGLISRFVSRLSCLLKCSRDVWVSYPLSCQGKGSYVPWVSNIDSCQGCIKGSRFLWVSRSGSCQGCTEVSTGTWVSSVHSRQKVWAIVLKSHFAPGSQCTPRVKISLNTNRS